MIEKEKKSILRLAMMIILSTLTIFNSGFDHKSVYYNAMFGAIAIAIYIVKEKRDYRIDVKSPIFIYTIILIWSLISLTWSITPLRTVIEFIEMSIYAMLFFMASSIDEDDFFQVGKVLAIIGTIIAGLGLLEYLLEGVSRISSVFPNQNPFGIFMGMLLLSIWGYEIRKSSIVRKISAIILLVALILSGSRGSMLCVIISLPLIFWNIGRERLLASIKKTVILVVIGLVLTQGFMYASELVQNSSFGNRSVISSTIRSSSLGNSSVGRFEFWRVGLDLIENKPIQGYGLGSFYSAYHIEYNMNEWYSRFTHNHYIQIAAELGVIGLGLFITFMGTVFWKAKKRLSVDKSSNMLPGIIAAMFAFATHIFIDFSWNFPAVPALFFAMAGFASNLNRVKETDESRGKKVVNRKLLIILPVLLLLVTVWQLSSLLVFTRAREISEEDMKRSNRIFETMNRVYPISHVGKSWESHNYNTLYLETGKLEHMERAIDLMEQAVELSPHDPDLHRNLGWLYDEIGEKEKAEYHLKLNVDYGVHSMRRYLDLGQFYLENDREEEVESLFKRALKLSEYAIQGVERESREEVAYMVIEINLYMARNCRDRGDEQEMEQYIDAVNELLEEYPGAAKYLDL